jgi:DNA-binding CsgD family transcriptional regulator
VVTLAAAAYDQRVLEHAPTPSLAPTTIATLTRRELEVLQLTSGGLTNAGVAGRLGLSVHAVKFHLASIFRKLSVANRTEAAALWFSHTAASHVQRDGPI